MSRIIKLLRRLIDHERWFIFATLTASAAWLVAAGISLPLVLIAQPESLPDREPWIRIFSGLLLAPMIENLIMIAMIRVARKFVDAKFSVAMMVAIMALIHAIAASWMAIAASVGFLVYGASYVLWYPSGGRRAYWITVLQHAIFNLPATLAGIFLR